MNGVSRPRRGIGHAILIVLAPVVVLYAVATFLAIDRTPNFGMRVRFFRVIQVMSGGPADRAGFRVDDQVITQNGISRDDMLTLLREHGRIRPGDEVRFTVDRQGEEIELVVTTATIGPRDRIRVISRTAVALCFLAVGIVVYRNRFDRVAKIFYLVSVFFAFYLIEPPATGDVRLQMLIKIARDAAILLLPPLFLHFVLLFPHEKRVPPWMFFLRPLGGGRIRFPLYAASLVLFLVASLLTVLIYTTGETSPATLALFQLAVVLYLFGCIVAGVGAFFHSYAKTRSPVMRRKLRGVLVGTTVALVPIVFFNVWQQIHPEVEFAWSGAVFLLAAALPISFGHAIVRYRLLDIELIIKRSILYTLLTAFLAMTYLVFVELVSRVLRQVAGSSDIPATLLSLFLIALLFSPTRELIQRWVDRTFYREKYEHRRTLHEFSTALTSILDRNILLRQMTERISTTLHVPKVAVFLRDPAGPGGLVLQGETGLGGLDPDLTRFDESDRIPGLLKASADILPVEQMSDAERAESMTAAERERIGRLDSALLLPLLSGEEMVGLISLGRKRSGEFFSHEDRQLLRTLANHAALAIENSTLHHNTIEKERLEQELRLAREIQLGFLPAAPPDLPEVELAARNVPCEEIGGDYYDFIITRPYGLGIAIGDATGDGVPAALLMANLQASFRVEVAVHPSPSEALAKVNTFTYRQTQDTRFVTFFYGVIDLKTGLFRYANAGHNPPMLVHPIGTWRYLDQSDLILGVDPGTVYREHAMHLSEGDMLVLYTDGVTDEPNGDDESFGMLRLEQIVIPNRHLPAAELCDLILRGVTEFMGEEPGDDVTLMVVKLR
ncbi:MAG: SpoIIE family protein phosphatase [Candidatus Eisenbacteria bacterium]